MGRFQVGTNGFALILIAAAAFAAPCAHAQATRTWVSGVGDDANPCSRTAPCKTFAGAINKTAAGGEMNVIDPGGFGAVTINKAITIQAVGVESGVLVSGTNGIIVAAGPADTVNIVGLDIFTTTAGANSGIVVMSAGTVHVLNCTIRNFATGIAVHPSTTTFVVATDTVLDQNTVGVSATSSNQAARAFGVLDHLSIFGTGAATSSSGVLATGAYGAWAVNNSTILRYQTGLNTASGGTIYSFGNNRLGGNAMNGTPNSSLPLE